MDHALEPTADPAWVLHADGFNSLRESSLKSRFAISNGFLGIRGARAITRGARWVIPPRTYVAGLFDTAGAEPATPGLVPAADWLQVRVMLPGGPLVHHPGDVASHRMSLDVRRGAFLTQARQVNAPDLGIRLRTLRLVSLSERAVGLQLIQLEIEEGEVAVTLEASFEGVDLGLVSERLDQDLRHMAHETFRQAPRYGDLIVTANRRPRPCANGTRPAEMVLELEISPRAGRVF